MQKFDMYLAVKEGRARQILSRQLVMLYFLTYKNSLLKHYPQRLAAAGKHLIKNGLTLNVFAGNVSQDRL